MTQEKQIKLTEAAYHTQAIKRKLNDLRDLGIFPQAQLKDIANTLDNLHRKAQIQIEKEERMNRNAIT